MEKKILIFGLKEVRKFLYSVSSKDLNLKIHCIKSFPFGLFDSLCSKFDLEKIVYQNKKDLCLKFGLKTPTSIIVSNE